MGIRIHKTLGFLIEDVKLNLEALADITLEDLRNEFISDQKMGFDFGYPNINLKETLDNFVEDITDSESDPNAKFQYLILPPFVGEKWKRYDDTVDYYDHEGPALTSVKLVHNEIFPYCEKFVVSSNLTELNDTQKQQCFYFSDVEVRKNFTKELREQMEALGLDWSKPLKNQIHMTAPRIVQEIARKAGLQETKKLRAAIATYWR